MRMGGGRSRGVPHKPDTAPPGDYTPPPLRKHGRRPKSPGKTALQRPHVEKGLVAMLKTPFLGILRGGGFGGGGGGKGVFCCWGGGGGARWFANSALLGSGKTTACHLAMAATSPTLTRGGCDATHHCDTDSSTDLCPPVCASAGSWS